MLFANRVRPWRFAASLLLTAASYPVGPALLALSTVLLADALFGQELPTHRVVLVALWSFAPHLFGALILTPYVGNLIALVLAAWTFAAMTAGIHAVSALSLTQTALCLALGWLLWQLLRRSLGRAAVWAARWLGSRVAGEPLVTDREGLERLFQRHKDAALAALQTDREEGG